MRICGTLLPHQSDKLAGYQAALSSGSTQVQELAQLSICLIYPQPLNTSS